MKEEQSRGYIHVYTGNGKGKTTAAFGLALRAACSGKNVYIGQFIKDMAYSETKITQLMDKIQIEQLGLGCFIKSPASDYDIQKAREALSLCEMKIMSEKYDLVILDEVNIALHYQLIDIEKLMDVLAKKPKQVEVVLTGRYAPEKILSFADLVTEMKEIKHYYQQGVLSREGFDC